MDEWFGSKIQFDDKHPQPKHKSKMLGVGQQRIFIVGQSGCGKTTVLRSIIPQFTDDTTHCFICSCVVNNAVHDAIGEWCKSKGIIYEKFTEPYTAKQEILALCDEKKLNDHAVIVFDDFMSPGAAERKCDPYNLLVTECINWRRNDNFSIIVICQYYCGLSPRSRVSINRRFIFKCENTTALERIRMDVSPIFENTGIVFDDCYRRFVLPNLYNYLCVSSAPQSVYAICFDDQARGRVIPIIEGGKTNVSSENQKKRRQSRSGGTAKLKTMAETSAGEIAAGNDSYETQLLAIATKIAITKSAAERDKLINIFTDIANAATDVTDDAIKEILARARVSQYFDFK